MDLITELETLLDFSPVLIATFAGLAMLYVQVLKAVSTYVRDYPLPFVLILTLAFSGAIVFEVGYVLEIAIINYLLMISAMGIYSGSKNKVELNLADAEIDSRG
jgi:hypothetical protein